jgi:hypothetical protein
MKKIQKLQVTLNEVIRMQQLAGIEPLNELSAGLRNRAAIKARDRGGKVNMVGQSKSESIFEIPKKYQDIAYKIAESISTYFTDLVFTSPKGVKDCKVNIVNPYLIKDATASKDVYIDLSFYSTDVYNNTAEKKYKLKETFALYRMYMRKKFFGLSSKIEESTSDSFSEYIAKCKLNGTDRMPSNSNGESVSGIDNEIKSLLNKLKSELGAKITEASNNATAVGKTVFSDGKGKLFFGYYNEDGSVHFVDFKKWEKLSMKDVSKGDTNKNKVIDSILRNQKQFNKKVDFNMWSKKTNPSFEDKMDYFIKNGWISNISKAGIVTEVKDTKKWTPKIQKDFDKWRKSDNVVKNSDGTYSTQDAQWRNKLKDLEELKQYFTKEFVD